ncbi:MAG: hypothetical protein B6242_10395 [Anaerolineaceae bacterium 4572_78]|nr:MAG: hypothetical protein B6242_10395 [Anaerolineaceae bacterium 4572_78]
MDLVGMANFAKRQIGELSGGQQQRVFIARALAQEAELVLMDEPLNGLDINSQADILDILKTLSQREVTVMITTHDLNAVVENFDRVMLLNQRVLAFGSAEHVLTPILLNQAYQGRMQLVKTKEGTIVIHPNLENRHKRHTHV